MGWRGVLGICGAAGALFAIASACGSKGGGGGLNGLAALAPTPAFDSLGFSNPVELVQNPTGVSASGRGRDGEVYPIGFGTPSIEKRARADGRV